MREPFGVTPRAGSPSRAFSIQKISEEGCSPFLDSLAVEEPLEIRVLFQGEGGHSVTKPLSITMRTPGHDPELAAGFLFTEGIVRDFRDILDIQPCGTPNVIKVQLRPGLSLDLERLNRHFYTSSSCGVCGKSSIDALKQTCSLPGGKIPMQGQLFSMQAIHLLPDRLRQSQKTFDCTGGLHASGIFNSVGELILAREDVGRHNALDKVIGANFLAGELPLTERLLLVSGRASFELVQKAAMAGIPVLAAVGAPSSLAVELAQEVGMTLLGFVRNNRFNIYHGAERLS